MKLSNRHPIRSLLFAQILILGLMSPAMAQELKPIYFGTPTRSVAWFPLCVAIKRGFLQKEGINIEPVVMDSRVIVPSMAGKAYDAIRDMWPSDGTTSEQGLRNAISVAEIAPSIPHEQLVNWTLLKETLAASKNEFQPR
jgi:ABC-type nitrate/sulfonate/bicarbonate transport system substrate-binding protein